MLGLSFKQMCTYEGYLDKRKTGKISLFKKRFFKIIDTQLLVYQEHSNSETFKGYFKISEISEPMPTSEKQFSFTCNGQQLEFKADSYQERERWIYSISHCRDCIKNNQGLLKNLACVLRNNGLLGVEDTMQKEKILKSLGFGNNLRLIRLNQEKYKMRFFSSFVCDNTFGKHKKRFLILYSRRPLSNRDYIFEKEVDSEFYNLSRKDWLKYDTIFLFRYEKIKGSYKTSLRDEIDLSKIKNIHLIEDKERHIYLISDKPNVVYDISLKTKEERDELFEYLSNSYRTSKLMLLSKTGKPRNVAFLNYLFKNNKINELQSFIEDEKKKIAIEKQNKNFNDINIFNKNFRNTVMSIIDGCLSNNPQYIKVLNYYLNEMNSFFYQELNIFWKEHKDILNIQEIFILSMQLKTWSDQLLNVYNICDCDLEKNIKKLMKIFIREKYIINMKYIKELINKSLVDDVSTPNELIILLTKTLEILQMFVHKYTYEQITILIHNCIIQYLLGIDNIILDYNKEINDSSLIKIINNLTIIRTKINTIIVNLSENGVLNQGEIMDLLQYTLILNNFDIVIKNSLFRLTYNNINQVKNTFYNIEGIKKINATKGLTRLIKKDLAHIYDNLQDYNKKEFMRHLLYWIISYSVIMILNMNNNNDINNINKEINKYVQNIQKAFQFYIEPFPKSTLNIIEDIVNILSIVNSKTFENDGIEELIEKIHSIAYYFDYSFSTSLINIITEVAGFTNEKKIQLINEIKSDCFKSNTNEFNLIFWTIWNDDKNNKNPFLISIFDQISQDYQVLYKSNYQETTVKILDMSLIKEGFLKVKLMNKWKSFYFQLKSTELLRFKDNSCKELIERIELSDILYYQNYKDNHLLLLFKYIYKNENELFMRKYYCNSQEETEEWIKSIKECIEKLKDYNKVIIVNGKGKLIEEKVGMDETFMERYSIRNISLNQESLNIDDDRESNFTKMSNNVNNMNVSERNSLKSVLIDNYFQQKENLNKSEDNYKNEDSNKSIKLENCIFQNDKKSKEKELPKGDAIKQLQLHNEENQFNLSQKSPNIIMKQLPEIEHSQIQNNNSTDNKNKTDYINSLQQNSIIINELPSQLINVPSSSTINTQTNNNSIQTINFEIEQRNNHNEEEEIEDDKGKFSCLKCLFFCNK